MAEDKKAAAAEEKPKKAPAEKKEKAPKKKKGEGGPGYELAPAGKADQKKGPARLKVRYDKEMVPALQKELGFKNRMQVPRLEKVVVNIGLGEAITNAKLLESAVTQLATLAGQKPVITRARKAIANFKLRQGQPIGVMVTLRNDRAWEFLDRLVNVALPRVRDFKGVSPKAFDGKGNYTLGIREQIIFPEINYESIEKIKGLNVSIVTTARNDEEGRALLRQIGMPFRT